MMKSFVWGICLVVVVGACARKPEVVSLPASVPPAPGEVKTLLTLKYIDIVKGTGKYAEPGKCYYALYTGWLTDGKRFDTSFQPDGRSGKPQRDPLSFEQGKKNVIIGWDVGFEGMNVGGKRRLFIPYELAYGFAGSRDVIPPKALLVFDVELMDVRDAPTPVARGAPGTPAPPAARCPPWSS